jgi:hypothetical protein
MNTVIVWFWLINSKLWFVDCVPWICPPTCLWRIFCRSPFSLKETDDSRSQVVSIYLSYLFMVRRKPALSILCPSDIRKHNDTSTVTSPINRGVFTKSKSWFLFGLAHLSAHPSNLVSSFLRILISRPSEATSNLVHHTSFKKFPSQITQIWTNSQ